MKLKNLFFVVLSPWALAQSTFSHDREWATYFGGVNTGVYALHEDSSSNIHVDGFTGYGTPNVGTPPAAYYSQFITAGGQAFTPLITNNLNGTFSAAGNLLAAGYSPYGSVSTPRKRTVQRDANGNRYDIESQLSAYPALPSGVWLSAAVDVTNLLLFKYDSAGNLLWQTYLPGNSNFEQIEIDSAGNIYILGKTQWQNLGDAGTFQPAFSMVYDINGDPMANSYLVKLSPQGQKIWATYTPSSFLSSLTTYNDKLYIAGHSDLSPTGSDLATAGTFQTLKSQEFIAEINTSNGQRIWGTYYSGTPAGNSGQISDMKADATGVYVTGMTYGSGTYYATEGAYRSQCTDGSDLFVSKFNSSGRRVWSTYIGTDDIEIYSGDRGLDVKDGKVLLTGVTFGSANIATTGAYQDVKPNPNSLDLFFSMLNAGTGMPDFISYYGGTGNSVAAGTMLCAFSSNTDGFYLYGQTDINSGFSASNGWQPNIIYPSGITVGMGTFIARFSPKNLSVKENASSHDMVLYDNPSNGNFSIKGQVLAKKPHTVSIIDLSGRLVYTRQTSRKETEHFQLQNILQNGTYVVSVATLETAVVNTFKLMIRK